MQEWFQNKGMPAIMAFVNTKAIRAMGDVLEDVENALGW